MIQGFDIIPKYLVFWVFALLKAVVRIKSHHSRKLDNCSTNISDK